MAGPIDYTCLVHGKKMSEHDTPWFCLYCCQCFKSLTPEECAVEENGQKVDVCKECYEKDKPSSS